MQQRTYKITLYLLMFNMFIAMCGIGIIVPVMPAYLDGFENRGQIYGLLIAMFSFSQLIFSPLIGKYSDRYGRKPFIVMGLFIYSFAQWLFGATDILSLLFVSRFLSGVAGAFLMPTILAYVGDITPIAERGKGMSLVGAASTFGFMIGPGIGGVLAEWGLSLPFYFAGGLALVSAFVTMYMLPKETRQQGSVPEGKHEHIGQQLVRSVKLPYFVFLIVVFTFSFGIANIHSIISLYLDEKFSYSPLYISIILAISSLGGVCFQIFAINKLFRRFGELKVIAANLLIAAVTMYCLVYVSGYFIILFVFMLNAIASSLIRPAVNTVISKMAGNAQGFAAGINNAYMSLGNMVGPLCAGFLYDWHMDAPLMFGALVLVGSFIMCISWSTKQKQPMPYVQ